MSGRGFGIATRLAADPATVWGFVGSAAGIQRELAPLALALPAELQGPDGLQRLLPRIPGRSLFTATVTLFGFLPLDRHCFGFAELTPGVGFAEQSTTLWLKDWRHQRQLQPIIRDGETIGTLISDRIWLQGRIPGLDRLLLPLYRQVFRRRHGVLRECFRSLPETEPATASSAA